VTPGSGHSTSQKLNNVEQLDYISHIKKSECWSQAQRILMIGADHVCTCAKICVQRFLRGDVLIIQQESCAIAKMTARCALYK